MKASQSTFVYEHYVSQIIDKWAKGKPYTDASIIKDINPNLADIATATNIILLKRT